MEKEKVSGRPFEKGNTFGEGRPPKFTDEELASFGEELLLWMDNCDKNDKCDVVHLSEWYYREKKFTPLQWDAIRDRPRFRQYYEQARNWIGVRTLKNKKLSESYGNRFLTIYFKDLKDHEREKKRNEIEDTLAAKKAAENQEDKAPREAVLERDMKIVNQNVKIRELEEKIAQLESLNRPQSEARVDNIEVQ